MANHTSLNDDASRTHQRDQLQKYVYILNDRSSANVNDDVGGGDDQPRPPPH